LGQRNILRAGFDAVLSVPALLDSAIAHERSQALTFERSPSRMGVEQAHLSNRGRANKSCVFIELGADLHAAAAGNAPREWIGLLLFFHAHARTRAEVVSAINRYPGFHALEVFKQHAAING